MHLPHMSTTLVTPGVARQEGTEAGRERQLLLLVHEAEQWRENLTGHLRFFLREDTDFAPIEPLAELLREEKHHWIIALSTMSDARREEHLRFVKGAQCALTNLFIFCRMHAKNPHAWQEQENHLRRVLQSADAAMGELISMHGDYVHALAHRFCRRSGLDHDDVAAEGMTGLLRAIREFDLTRGTRLLTHATSRIRAAMSAYAYTQLNARMHEVQLIAGDGDHDPWEHYARKNEEDDPTPLGQVMEKEQREEERARASLVREHINALRPAHRDILRAIHGFDGNGGMSNGEYGRRKGTSKEAARTLLHRAHQALRKKLEGVLKRKQEGDD